MDDSLALGKPRGIPRKTGARMRRFPDRINPVCGACCPATGVEAGRSCRGFGRPLKPAVMIAELVPETTRRLRLADEAATAALARALAPALGRGDVIALWGDLGAGKTRFARALIGALAGESEEVPSPTFTLAQSYDIPSGVVWHFDLYRLESPEEALELGIDEALADGIALIEWPGRLGALLPRHRLDLTLDFAADPQARIATLAGHGTWAARLPGLDLS
jgi:tRNA threonylcarbamoyladenosine biosynthesis protein TsaE